MNVIFFGFKRAGLAYIDANQAAQLDNATVKAGDILLNITGASIGRVTLAPDEFEGARAVSYTHLDVYKRQPVDIVVVITCQ